MPRGVRAKKTETLGYIPSDRASSLTGWKEYQDAARAAAAALKAAEAEKSKMTGLFASTLLKAGNVDGNEAHLVSFKVDAGGGIELFKDFTKGGGTAANDLSGLF